MNIEIIVKKMQKGDHQAFIKVYDLYFNQLKIFIQRYVHAETTAEDLTQDVFVKLWEKRDYLESVVNFNAYIYRIAKNHTLDYLKRVSRLELTPDNILREFNFTSDEVELFVTEQEYFSFLDAYLTKMPQKSQEIFRLCREQEKSYDEVAQMLNISKSTVKHHMITTMKRLKKDILDKLRIHHLRILYLILFYKILLPF